MKDIQELKANIGQELGISEWFLVTQERVDAFAQVTDDTDWMHIDVPRATAGPMKGTIGQGFLTLSLLTKFSHELDYWPQNVSYALNYGLDRVRWITPVPVGGSIRNRVRLLSVEPREPSGWLIKTQSTIEIQGHERPAMIATWLGLLQLSDLQADPA